VEYRRYRGRLPVYKPEAKAEYFADVSRVDPSPVAFVRNYTKMVPTLSLHAGTHPPGPVLYLWAVSRVFGNGIVAAALSAIIGTALSMYPFSLLARTILGPATSRYAVAMYAVTPTLVLFGATSMDGVFVFFPLLATYFFHKSWSQNPVRYSILTGFALAAAMFFTFMSVCIGFVFTVEAILSTRAALSHRIWRNLVYAGLTFALVHWLLWVLTGYNVIHGFKMARRMASAYRSEMYPDLWHYVSVSVANLAAFLIGVGVITVTLSWREIAEGWSAWRARRSTDLLSIAVSAVVILLAFATIFCVETERVWMFLVPLPILAAARHLDRHQSANPRSNAWCVVLILLFTQTLATELFLNTLW
jgi:4-amino-4-deoxy-L-arabinose transferase-like glycosyltransferase